MRLARSFGIWITLVAYCYATCAHGEPQVEECSSASADCAVVGQWKLSVSLGAGVRTNPLVDGRNIPLVVIPHVSYYGKHFFLDNLDLGVTLLERPTHSVSLIATPGVDRAFFVRNDPQNYFIAFAANTVNGAGSPPPVDPALVPHTRQFTYLAGLEGTLRYQRLFAQLDLLQEVTGRHHGSEIRAAVSLLTEVGNDTVVADIGGVWKSEAVVSYYYGESLLYDPGSALDPFVRISWKRPVSDHWQLTAYVHVEHLGRSIVDSPIVANSIVTTAFAGATYRF